MKATRIASAAAEVIRLLEALDPGASSWPSQTSSDAPTKRTEVAVMRHDSLGAVCALGGYQDQGADTE